MTGSIAYHVDTFERRTPADRREEAPRTAPRRDFGEYDDYMRREYARYLADAGRHAEAAREIDGLVAAGTADGADYELRGLCRLAAGNDVALTLALADFDSAQRLHGADVQRVQVHLATCLNRLGRHAEALARVDDAVTAKKYPDAAQRERIEALIGLRHARELVGALNAYAPKCPELRMRAGDVLREAGLAAEALGQFAIVVRAHPDDRYALWAIGDCLIALGRRNEAVEWFGRAERAYLEDGDGVKAEICHRASDEARGRRGVLAWLFAR
jgi:tetratricopeptide (TPR) repeat protein